MMPPSQICHCFPGQVCDREGYSTPNLSLQNHLDSIQYGLGGSGMPLVNIHLLQGKSTDFRRRVGEIVYQTMMHTIHAHPTLYEAVGEAFSAVYGLAINA